MQTQFTPEQLRDPHMASSEGILRNCVHCGFCTATCPTYVLLGDENDSPRGRIYLIKDMLESGKPPSAETVQHVDRCLSCLSCMTTCPSGVNYMHLVDHARVYIERHYSRPWPDRLLRRVLGLVLPKPAVFRLALLGARLVKPFLGLMKPATSLGHPTLLSRVKAMLSLAPASLPAASPTDQPQVFLAEGVRRARVALMVGCAQKVLAPAINESTIRLLTRHGCEVVVAPGSGCCGALTHHLGQDSHGYAQANIDAWAPMIERGELDAIVINASGCGTTVKDYGFMLRDDAAYAAKAAAVSARTRDIAELMGELGLMPAKPGLLAGPIAYHSACSLQHGQQVRTQPKALLEAAGFQVADIPDGHLCCGSAGTYNIMQPEMATALRDLKVRNIERIQPVAVAAGNIGCLTQIGNGTALPVVHTVELLDWATGGPKPEVLGKLH
ncbi:MAG TPA: glycolate oxidase subunit GlcF [Stellaceae bacterium]|jgi:glycolate oxidase iron-sulfur subunit|nr:glycolate oxidase subunit GlcF [Stellaceae bacterium]